MKRKPLKVGFDLDGVILYNPARIMRPAVALVKDLILKKKKLKFYIPQTPQERYMWHLFHKSSLFIAPGFSEIRTLAEKGIIEPYIITARYSFLKPDLDKWLKKADAYSYFKACIHNEKDEQPHLYKERMMRELKLDVFIEDNLDIVLHLAKSLPDKKIIWVYNLLDINKDYPLKVPHLKKGIEIIKSFADET